MPEYGYVAKATDGKERRSTLAAGSRYEALAGLRERGLTVLELQEIAAPSRQAGAAPTHRGPRKRPIHLYKVSLGEKAIFCRQLSISVSSGVPLRESLESIAEDMENPSFKRTLTEIVIGLHEGKTFSETLSQHGKIFTPLFVSLIKTAEESGSMPATLEDLATSLEKTERLVRKVRSITAYPVFVAVFFCIVCTIMTLFVLPQFQRTFESFGARLPLLTRAVFKINQFIIRAFPVIAALVFLLTTLLVLYARTVKGRLRVDRFKLSLPLFGLWIRKFSVARFCRNLAIMMRGGVPITSAIEIASGTCGNRALEESLMRARDRIVNGISIAASLGHEEMFPRLVVRMVSVGESSGRLPEVLEKVSDVYEDQVEGEIMTATALFEPVIITFFGAIVLVLVLAIYVPVFTLAGQMR